MKNFAISRDTCILYVFRISKFLYKRIQIFHLPISKKITSVGGENPQPMRYVRALLIIETYKNSNYPLTSWLRAVISRILERDTMYMNDITKY